MARVMAISGKTARLAGASTDRKKCWTGMECTTRSTDGGVNRHTISRSLPPRASSSTFSYGFRTRYQKGYRVDRRHVDEYGLLRAFRH